MDQVRFKDITLFVQGIFIFYNISEHAKLISNNVAQIIKTDDLPVTIRFGRPSIIPIIETQYYDSIPLSSTESYPCSYVIEKTRGCDS